VEGQQSADTDGSADIKGQVSRSWDISGALLLRELQTAPGVVYLCSDAYSPYSTLDNRPHQFPTNVKRRKTNSFNENLPNAAIEGGFIDVLKLVDPSA
jgi:hypothetical protein